MRAVLIFTGALLAATVQAQEPPFPQKAPIEITVLFPAGSSADVTARLLADGMSKQLGAKVIVYNRPGAGGAIGYTYVAAQKPDGYWLVWNSNSISTTYHSGSLPFDYQAFDAVARVLVESPVLAVGGGAKWKTLADLVADAKSRPKQISVGNSGIGSHTHISAVALFKAAGIDDEPVAAVELSPQLARRPSGIAREETDLRRRVVEQRVDRVRHDREVKSREHGHGRAGKPVGLEHGEQALRRHRSAEEYRLLERFEAFARQHFRERAVGGPVDDHAGSFRAFLLGDQHHGFAEIRVGHPGSCDEENGSGRALCVRGRRKDEEREKRGTARWLHPAQRQALILRERGDPAQAP